jgi:hypothetical protein
MTDRARYSQVEAEIRQQMGLVIQILQPYARSSGGFSGRRSRRQCTRSSGPS